MNMLTGPWTSSFNAALAFLITNFNNNRPLLVLMFLVIHFLKRDLEVLFLHKYSAPMEAQTASVIGCYYTFISWLIHFFSSSTSTSTLEIIPSQNSLLLGSALFFVGQLGNFYHHYLLSTLRSKSVDSSSDVSSQQLKKYYSVPQGGLFGLVTMPHYFFELLAWLGLAVVSMQTNVFLVFCSMTSYLCGRSVASSQWYLNNIDGYPKNRKHIIPFIF